MTTFIETYKALEVLNRLGITPEQIIDSGNNAWQAKRLFEACRGEITVFGKVVFRKVDFFAGRSFTRLIVKDYNGEEYCCFEAIENFRNCLTFDKEGKKMKIKKGDIVEVVLVRCNYQYLGGGKKRPANFCLLNLTEYKEWKGF